MSLNLLLLKMPLIKRYRKNKYTIYNLFYNSVHIFKITLIILSLYELFLYYFIHLHWFMKILLTGWWVLGWQWIIKCLVHKQLHRWVTSWGVLPWSQWWNGASKDACCGLLAPRSPSSPTAIQHTCDGGDARQTSHHTWNFTKHNIKCM